MENCLGLYIAVVVLTIIVMHLLEKNSNLRYKIKKLELDNLWKDYVISIIKDK